ncbi:MBL fold metallo-hydrolase [Nonomuraea maritima]|uniref:MBL fold metallo-hydrolase n=1 Tax=Nonomuraea maritima TaxID=683260 RepID=UPI003713D8A0
MPPEIRRVPLGGHTAGHTGVAVREGDRRLLHCGDACYYRELDRDRPTATARRCGLGRRRGAYDLLTAVHVRRDR